MSTHTASPRLNGETVKYRSDEINVIVTKLNHPCIIRISSRTDQDVTCIGGIFPDEMTAMRFANQFAQECSEGSHVR